MITLSNGEKKLLDDLKKSNYETYFHCLRVKKLTMKLLEHMNSDGATDYSHKDIDIICKGALFHDIGKLYVKNVVLTKKSTLSDEEKGDMRNHTIFGYNAIKDELTDDEQEIIKNIILYHHDRVDGLGYNNIKDVPLYVQIVSVCDVFDAVHTDRIYRPGLKTPACLQLIRDGKSGQFDENIIRYLTQVTCDIE